MKKEILIEIICALFILLFVYAALNKLEDFEKFRIQLGQSPILAPFAGWVVWIIPISEISIALLFLFKHLQLIALYTSFSLMVMFTTYIITILNFSEYIPCSCGGILQNMTWNDHLLFNTGFLSLGMVGILLYPTKNDLFIAQ